MSNPHADSPIAPTIQALLALFEGELQGVKFPDVDREVLLQGAARVHALAEEQARAEARLQAAREALQEGQDALLHRCQRAAAYARIFAEDNPELLQKLDGIGLPRGRARAAAPVASEESRPSARRGRRSAQSGGLFLEVAVAEEGEQPAAQ